ncbi:S-adenosyl-L-methionine-dependent methyltransferase [Fragilariopsis cylindrus CCMP1102]|uniref:S-adenosyl-L-methionine-dependent methyltransferase n=1 Tax=Fragilariopsis cylindrus CCMP1102 TaxID=635003 RepID=A0A1E7FX87_9STRA|nr:S-adenosyl-L-methionine-dependent methyltransferase [Fragilariopsis cylindrus CCMP1102]|eukprot:OEU22760.1 S-adenosyl-L-methionine-dependent methyltransferase [Fragilariopsis cylindrus CCMP1102]
MFYSQSSSSSCRKILSISFIVLYVIITTTLLDSIITINGFSAQSCHISWKRKASNTKQGQRLSASGKGFEAISSEEKSDSLPLPPPPSPSSVRVLVEEPDKNNGRKIYSMPSLYDMAFGYRNFEEEVDFLLDQHRLLNEGNAPRRILELAAGPARHSIDALKSYSYVESATAIDNSAEMIEYAKEIATKELKYDEDNDDDDYDDTFLDKVDCFNYIQADMSNFTILDTTTTTSQSSSSSSSSSSPATSSDLLFDSAWILLGSLQHLTTNTQVISCFNCIHRVLQPGGTLILELPHPRETFSLVECTRNGWSVPLEDENGNTSGELKIIWGDDNDDFDPIKQVRQFTVSMELTGNHATISHVSEVVPMRHFTSQEIDALARIAGFEVMSMHGAVAHDVDVNDEDQSFRLVCVLQKQ